MTLQKKILRGLRKNLSFYLTGSLLTALCIMLWVGAFSVSRTASGAYTRLFEESDLEDGQFTVSSPISDQDITALESEFNVILERQRFRNISYGETTVRLFADAQKTNKAVILEGKPLSGDNCVLLTYNYAKAQGLSVGDYITLAGIDFEINGLCLKPDYAAMYANFEDSFPNSTDFGIALISENTMRSIGGYSSYYSVKYPDTAQEVDFRAAVYSRYGTLEYIGKSANPRTGGLLSQAADIEAEFSVYSPIIMLVVVVVIAMVLGRTVRRESRTIGTLMALGYRRGELIRHYMWYALIPAVFGDVLGLALCYPFAKLFNLYMFSFAEHIVYQVKVPVGILISALLIPPTAYGASALLVLARALGQDIVPLLKGSAKGKTAHMLSRSRLPFPLLYGIRSLCGNISRSLTMIVGIAVASMAVILAGVYQDAYDEILVGISDGGVLAQLYAKLYMVGGLIMVSTLTVDSTYVESVKKEKLYMPLMKVYIKNTKFDKLRVRLVESVKKHFRNETDEEKNYAVSFLECVGSDESYRYMFLRAIQATNDITRLERFKKSDFGYLAGKVLVLIPENDMFDKADSQKLVDIFTDPVVKQTYGGHMGLVMRPDLYLPEIEHFLSERF